MVRKKQSVYLFTSYAINATLLYMTTCQISNLVGMRSGDITIVWTASSCWDMCNGSIWIVGTPQRLNSNFRSSLRWFHFPVYKLRGKFGGFSFKNPSSWNCPKFPLPLPKFPKSAILTSISSWSYLRDGKSRESSCCWWEEGEESLQDKRGDGLRPFTEYPLQQRGGGQVSGEVSLSSTIWYCGE